MSFRYGRTAHRASAIARTCPKCKRKGALVRIIIPERVLEGKSSWWYECRWTHKGCDWTGDAADLRAAREDA